MDESMGTVHFDSSEVSQNELSPSTPLKLNDEDYFYENAGYDYSGVYMGYLIRKYGKEAYKKVYSESEPLEKYIYNGFEDDAIDSFLMK